MINVPIINKPLVLLNLTWLVVEPYPTPLKNDGVKVSWDDKKFPTEWKNKSHVPNHQPAIFVATLSVLLPTFW